MSQPSTGATAGDSTPVVSVRGLRKSFRGGAPVIDGLDLDVRPRESVALIGANGTGKSTLLRCLIRLADIDQGRIRVLGEPVEDLAGRRLAALRSRVGFVFQKHNLVARLSALTNVVHGVQSRLHGPRSWFQSLAPAAVRAEAMECLGAVGLADKALQRADSLSGGQSQRVAIARMLMQRPALVLADEPDASLDPQSGAEIMDLLFQLTRKKGIALVFVSHHMEHALRYSDRVVGLAGHRVAFDAPAASLDEATLAAFFTRPDESRATAPPRPLFAAGAAA